MTDAPQLTTMAVPITPLPRRRLGYYAIQVSVFHHIFHRKIKLSGIPEGATFVRALYEDHTERIYLVYEHPSFEEGIEGVMPLPQPITVTTYFDEEPEEAG